ncbi:MAG: NUDIX domain-containing protein, partial [Planctomycetota bacterium]
MSGQLSAVSHQRLLKNRNPQLSAFFQGTGPLSREPIPTWFFVLVAVRHNNKYLLIHEAKHGQLWYFPAGRVEPGEDFIAAAKRETLE